MSLTLGEKLRQAREERGFTLSEVSEQTRISSLYLESIENDNYRILPGGIFNKGFVKSYAKFVGVNEQEALLDYAQLISASSGSEESELKLYKPEVLTDDRSTASMMPTIILAVVILALMTAGILFLLNYLRQPAAPVAVNTPQKTNVNSSAEIPANTETVPSNAPDMATLKVEFKALTQPVKVITTIDGQSPQPNNVNSGSSVTFTPKESLTLNYLRWNAPAVEMTINGKTITLPQAPLEAKDRDRIVFTISKDNLAQIWASGAISADAPPATRDANNNAATVPSNNTPTAVSSPVLPDSTPKPAAGSNTNAVTKPTPDRKPIETPKPSPTRKVIVVPNANRP